MTGVIAVALGLLVAAAGMTMVRLLRGPSTLDRIVALDVLLMLTAAGVAAWMVLSTVDTELALLVAVALIGFVGSVTGARLVEGTEAHR